MSSAERSRKWRAANPDKVRGYSLRYYRNNREKERVRKKLYDQNNQDKVLEWRKRGKLKRYGITPFQYDEMLDHQGGRCAICSALPNGKPLVVDHKHVDGYNEMQASEKSRYNRGLLCSNCNHLLGHAHEDASVLVNAAYYLTS